MPFTRGSRSRRAPLTRLNPATVAEGGYSSEEAGARAGKRTRPRRSYVADRELGTHFQTLIFSLDFAAWKAQLHLNEIDSW